MRLAPLVALAALFTLGCLSCPTGPKPSTTAAGDAAAPTSDVMAWGLDAAGRATSAWIDPTGNVTTRTGLVVAGGGRLWRWDVRPVPIPMADCACYSDLPVSLDARKKLLEQCTKPTPVDELFLTPLDGGESVPLYGAPPWDDHKAVLVGSVRRRWIPLGSVGSTLFLARDESLFQCGDRADRDSWTFTTVDLNGPRESTLLSPSDLNRLETVEKPKGAAALCQPPDCFQPAPEKVRQTLLRPLWHEDGALVLGIQYTGEAGSLGADGAWDSGTRSTVVEAAELPSALTGAATTPAAVRDWWRATGSPEVAGWSSVEASLRTAFAR